VRFIVDSTGHADSHSILIVAADDSAFAVAVRRAIARTHYHPAELAGHRVAQLVEQAFAFRIPGR
jgi:hypothetical protein